MWCDGFASYAIPRGRDETAIDMDPLRCWIPRHCIDDVTLLAYEGLLGWLGSSSGRTVRTILRLGQVDLPRISRGSWIGGKG
jgi:hypothetical protein